MPNAIPIQDWLDVMDREYLSTFIRDGGASVKFAVTPDALLRSQLSQQITERCSAEGYVCVRMNAAEMRAHMPQDIFFAMARQIDWRLLARRVVLRLAGEQQYRIDGIDPATTANVFDAVAAANGGLETLFVLGRLRPDIQDYVYRNPRMAKEFRVAMSHLCLAGSRSGAHNEDEPLLDWLTGNNTGVSGVRSFSIYTGINRTTARYFIESALYWVHFAGYAGTVILFDNTRVTLVRNPKDGLRYYTRAMVIDHYELLREFVDSVDSLNNTLMVIVANTDFLDESGRSRGYGIYPALMTRVMEDVRDRNLANPVASLVRLE